MSTLSLRLPDKLLKEVEVRAHHLHLPKGEYIRRAIVEMNRKQSSEERQKKLIQASQRVRQESKKVNAEFELIEYDPEA